MTYRQEIRICGYIMACTGIAVMAAGEVSHGFLMFTVGTMNWAFGWLSDRPKKHEGQS